MILPLSEVKESSEAMFKKFDSLGLDQNRRLAK